MQETSGAKDPHVPDSVIQLAKVRYFATLRRLEEDRVTFEEVDAYKEELRHYLTGDVVELSYGAQEHLAGYAIFCGVVPIDPTVKDIAEKILQYWKQEWRFETKLTGPMRSTRDLIKRCRESGIVIDGWLDMTCRDPGRPEVIGQFKLSLIALGSAVDELEVCWQRSNYGAKEKGRPSLAAKFYHRHISAFEQNVDVEDINYLLAKRMRKPRKT